MRQSMRVILITGFVLVGLCCSGVVLCLTGSGVAATKPSRAESAPAPYSSQIPFRLVANHIVFPVRINNSAELDMILDTGMAFEGAMLLDHELGDTLGLQYSGRIQLGGGGSELAKTADISDGVTLSVPGIDFTGQQIMVLREGAFANDWPAAAVIGGTLFDDVVEIDFGRSEIRLYDSIEDVGEDLGEEFDLTFTHGIPVVKATVISEGADPLPVRLMADTGVNDALLLFTHSDPGIVLPEKVIEGVNGVLGEGLTGDMKGKVGRTPRLQLGSYVFDNVVTCFPDEATMGHAKLLGQNGFVGMGILKRFSVVFDYSDKRLFLRPNENYANPFEWNMAGLLAGINRDGLLQVKDVMEGSPGLEKGIRADDVIIRINGRDVADLDNAEILDVFTQEGTRVELEIMRDSRCFLVSVTLRRLI
jgi:hypothetical protein